MRACWWASHVSFFALKVKNSDAVERKESIGQDGVHSLNGPSVIPLHQAGPEPKPGYSQCLEATEAPEHASVHGLQLVPRQHQLLHACCSVEGTLPHLLDPVVAQVSRRKGRSGRIRQMEGAQPPAPTLDSQLLCSPI